MQDEKFKLPWSSYDELIKIIRAYNHQKEPTAPTALSKASGINTTIISANNGFLVAIGVLEGGNKKILTNDGRQLATALDHEMPSEIRKHWRNIVMQNEFLSKLISAIKIRKGMDISTLHSHVAYSSGQPKKKGIMTGSRAVVDILKAAELVKDEDGKVVATSLDENIAISGLPITGTSKENTVILTSKEKEPSPVVTTETTREGLSISLQIQIQCAPSEVEDLGPKLRSLFEQLSKPLEK